MHSPPPASNMKAEYRWTTVYLLSWVVLLIVANQYFAIHPEWRETKIFSDEAPIYKYL